MVVAVSAIAAYLTISVATLLSIAMTVVSVIVQQQAAAKARDAQRKAQENAAAAADAAKGMQLVTDSAPDTVRVLYGRNLVGGSRVYHQTFNNYNFAAPAEGGQVFKASGNVTAPTYNAITWVEGVFNISALILHSAPAAVNSGLDSSMGGSKHEFLFTQQVLGFAGINAVYDVDIDTRKIAGEYINDNGEVILNVNPAAVPAGVKHVTPYDYGCRVHVYPGGNIADPLMVAQDPARSTAIFTNTAFATCVYRLNRDDPQFTSGVPTAQFYVEGMRVLLITGEAGFRTLSTEKAYSNNPVLCLLDYLLNPIYGRGLDVASIDLESFYDAYLICERVVQTNIPLEGSFWNAKGGIRETKMYECNLAIDTAKPIRENISTILETMNKADLIWSGGKYKLNLAYPEVYTEGVVYPKDVVVQDGAGTSTGLYKSLIDGNLDSPVGSANWSDAIDAYIDDDSIIREGETSLSWPNAQTRLNYATVKYLNESKDFAEDSVSWPPKTGVVAGAGIDRGTWSGVTAYNTSDKVTYTPIGYPSVVYQLSSGALRVNSIAPNLDPAWLVYNNNTVYAAYVAEDSGLPLETEQFATGATSYYSALAMAEYLVRSSRDGITYAISVDRRHVELEPGDIVRVKSNVLNIPGDLILLESVKPDSKGMIQLSGTRFDARNLAWNAKDDEVVEPRVIYDNALSQATGVIFSAAALSAASSSGRLDWAASSDIRTTDYCIRYTLDDYIAIQQSTTWIDIGTTSSLSFDLPLMIGGAYTLAVVAQGNGIEAPFYNQLDGTGWGMVAVGFSSTSVNGTTLQSVSIYARTDLQPSTPLGGAYDFYAKTMTVLPAGWYLTPPIGLSQLWVSQTIAESTGNAQTDTNLAWSTPVVTSDPTTYTIATKPVIGVLQDADDVNYGYTDAKGNMQVVVNGANLTLSTDVVYSVLSLNNCTLTVDNSASATRGAYSVTNLLGNLGSATIRATYLGTHSDVVITVSAVNVGYVQDLTPPPIPVNISTVVDYSTVFINIVDLLNYTQGHGHYSTEVFGSSASTVFNASTTPKLAEFQGSATSISMPLGVTMHIWLRYKTKDSVTGGVLAKTVVIGQVASAQIAAGSINTLLLEGGLATTISQASLNANTALTNAATAQNAATAAQASADAANSQITTISSDNVLSAGEKSPVILDYNAVTSEQSGIDTQATAYGITTEKTTYDNSVTALISYMATLTAPTLWSNTSGDTNIVGTTFRTKFSDVYTAKQNLLNKIYSSAKTLADTAQATAGILLKPLVSYDFQGTLPIGTTFGIGTTPGKVESAESGTATKLTNLASDQSLRLTSLSLAPTKSYMISMRVLWNSGDWEGLIFHSNTIHGESASYYKAIPAPTLGAWTVINLDMRTLSAGGTDYMTGGNVTALRFDFNQNVNSSTSVDWVSVGALGVIDSTTISNAQSAADAAQTAANTANADLADIASDNMLTAGEKPPVITDYNAIIAEQAGLDIQATAYAITTEKTDYDNSVTALINYMATLTTPVLWSNTADDTAIVGTTFRTKFSDVYTAKQNLLNKIYTNAKALADAASAAAYGRPNLLPNGGFELGLQGWTAPTAFEITDAPAFGRVLRSATQDGTSVIYSDFLAIRSNTSYTLTGDSRMQATSGSVYYDMMLYDSAYNLILDSTQNALTTAHDFNDDTSNRKAHTITVTTPSNAAFVKVRFVCENIVGSTGLGCRQIKLEAGVGPATPYSQEGAVISTSNTALAAMAELTTKLDNDAINVLSAAVELQTSGYAGGNGVAISNNGILAVKNTITTFAITSDGSATFGGALNAATGTFAGALNAATGTFGAVIVGASGSIASSDYAAGGTSGWSLSGDGTFRSQGAVDTTIISTGGVSTSRKVAGVDHVYKSLSHVETGVCTNGTAVIIPGYWASQPKVMVAPSSLMLYNTSYANQNQSIVCATNAISETAVGSMQYQFTPTATLNLAAATGSTVLNAITNSTADSWVSSTYTTAANTISVTPNISVTATRGTGTSGQYYLRNLNWRVVYYNGSAWVAGSWKLKVIGSTTGSVTDSQSFTFPSANAWQFYLEFSTSDAGGTFSTGAVQYNYTTATVTAAGPVVESGDAIGSTTVTTSKVTGTPTHYQYKASYQLEFYQDTVMTLPTYTPAATWSVYQVNYQYTIEPYLKPEFLGSSGVVYLAYTELATGSVIANTNPTTNTSITVGTNNYTSTPISRSYTLTTSSYANNITVRMNKATGGTTTTNYWGVELSAATVTIYLRQVVTNSTTPSNSDTFQNYGYSLNTAQVLATGSLQWIATGE